MTTGAPAQTVHFDQKHYTAVVSGAKVSTVRWREDIHEGPAIFIFDNHPTARPLAGQVTAVETYDLAHLSPLAARQPPGTDMTISQHNSGPTTTPRCLKTLLFRWSS